MRNLIVKIGAGFVVLAALAAAFFTASPDAEAPELTTTTGVSEESTTTTSTPETTTTSTSTSTTTAPTTTTSSSTTTTVPPTTSTTLGAPVGSFAAASFSVACGTTTKKPVVLRAMIDPIAVPGTVGATHSHDFVNARGMTENTTTAEQLMALGPPACTEPGDKSSYWFPTLLNGTGGIIEPFKVTAYYALGNNERPGAVVSPPQGLRYIVGNSKATAAQPRYVTSWGCVATGAEGGTTSPTIPTCPSGARLVLNVRFPQCWDGKNLDTADHKAHLHYRGDTSCPKTHPVWIPQLTLAVQYPVQGRPGYKLASGGQFSGHADVILAWDRAVLDRFVKECINGPKKCRP